MSETNKITIGEVRFSYLTVFEPRKAPGSDVAKYSTVILIPKKDVRTIEKVKAILLRLRAEAASLNGGKLPATFKLPWKDGDAKDPESGDFLYDENHRGHFFFTAAALQKPSVVDGDLKPIMDATKVYSGMWGYAAINFYIYGFTKKVGSYGIAAGLNHIMKSRDDESFGSRETVDEAFKGIKVTAGSLTGEGSEVDPLLGGF